MNYDEDAEEFHEGLTLSWVFFVYLDFFPRYLFCKIKKYLHIYENTFKWRHLEMMIAHLVITKQEKIALYEDKILDSKPGVKCPLYGSH